MVHHPGSGAGLSAHGLAGLSGHGPLAAEPPGLNTPVAGLKVLARLGLRLLLASVFLALALGAAFTARDWWLNPGGIFRDSTGSNWAFLADTFFSWFWPLLLTAFIMLALTRWLLRLVQRQTRRRKDAGIHRS